MPKLQSLTFKNVITLLLPAIIIAGVFYFLGYQLSTAYDAWD